MKIIDKLKEYAIQEQRLTNINLHLKRYVLNMEKRIAKLEKDLQTELSKDQPNENRVMVSQRIGGEY